MAEWIHASGPISAQPLAVLLLGNHADVVPQRLQPHAFAFPASNRDGGKCIIQGTILQVGTGVVQIDTDQQAIQHGQLQGIVSVRCEDFDSGEWQRLTQQPVKLILEFWEDEELSKAITTVWGRSWRNQGVPTSKEDATQMLREDEKRETRVLKRSGFSRTYISTMNTDGKFSSNQTIVWLAKDVSRAGAAQPAAGVAGQPGRTCGRNGFGIRVPAAQAATVAESLGRVYNAKTPVSHLYRIKPVPSPATAELIAQAKWQTATRVIKRLEQRTWLIGSHEMVQQNTVTVGGTPCLVTKIESHANATNRILLAGAPAV